MNIPVGPAPRYFNHALNLGDGTISMPGYPDLRESALFEVARFREAGSTFKDPKSPEIILPKVEKATKILIKGANSYLMGKACQDSVSLKEDPRYIIAAVSDGTSMVDADGKLKSKSEIGAKILSETAIELISKELERSKDISQKNLLDPEFLARVYQGLLRAILKDAEQHAKTFDDFRARYPATLNIFIRIKGGESIHLSIGDGVLAQESGQLELYQDKIIKRKLVQIETAFKDLDKPEAKKAAQIMAFRTPDLVIIGFKQNVVADKDFKPTLRVNAHGQANSDFAKKTVVFGSDGLNDVLWHQRKEGGRNGHYFPLVDFVSRPEEELNLFASLYQFCLMQGEIGIQKTEDQRNNLLRSLSELGDKILKDPSHAVKKFGVLARLSVPFESDTNLLSDILGRGLQSTSEEDLPLALARMRQAWQSLLKQEGVNIYLTNIRDDVGAVIIPAEQ